MLFLSFLLVGTLVASNPKQDEYYRMKFRQLQLLGTSYTHRPDSFYHMATDLMPELKKNGYDALYFSAWSMYLQELYYNEKQLQAQNEMGKMLTELRTVTNPEAEAQAYCAEGMLQMRFSELDAAEKSLRKAVQTCPPLRQCIYPRSRLVMNRWLMQVLLRKKKNIFEVLKMCDEQDRIYAAIRQQKRGDEYNRDFVLNKAQRAQALTLLGRLPEAEKLLEQCRSKINTQVSPILYQLCYEAEVSYYLATKNFPEALRICDFLIDYYEHGYRPLLHTVLKLKAGILQKAGKPAEAAAAYQRYIALDDSLKKVRTVNDLQEMQLQYSVYKLNLEHREAQFSLILMAAGLLFLLVFCILSLYYYAKVRKKNRLLVTRLEEMRRILKPSTPDTQLSDQKKLILDVQTYFDDPEHLADLTLTLYRVATELNTNTTYLRDVVREELGFTFADYVFARRLEYARQLLVEQNEEPINVIAQNCGFNSMRTFQRKFSIAYGLSPTDYRHNFFKKIAEPIEE